MRLTNNTHVNPAFTLISVKYATEIFNCGAILTVYDAG